MNMAGAFFRLIRWPNLVFIALTQLLFYYFIVLPSFRPLPHSYFSFSYFPSQTLVYLLSASSVLIAAAGYIINDYFDLDIDRVNKPTRLVVEKHIKRRWTIVWHWVLSGLGLAIGVYVSWKLHNVIILFSHIACIALLWFYSTSFKRKLLIGNLIISMLTAWVILILYFAVFRIHIFLSPDYQKGLSRIFKFAVLYGGFAFIISLIREVIKDIEDREGDEKYNCLTMPVVWGVNVSKVFAATWLVVLVSALIVVMFYILQYGWWWTVMYCLALIVFPLIYILRKLYVAKTVADYHLLSRWVKMVMLAGILSLLLF